MISGYSSDDDSWWARELTMLDDKNRKYRLAIVGLAVALVLACGVIAFLVWQLMEIANVLR